MFIELEYIFNNEGSGAAFDFELDLSAFEIGACKPFVKPFTVNGKVFNKTGVVTVKATVQSFMQMPCDRCACDINKPFEVLVERILVTTLNHEDNDEFLLVESMRIELEPLITEEIFLALPTKILCTNECKGLCANCGENLNNGQCGCQKPIDPRLEALKQLLDNQ